MNRSKIVAFHWRTCISGLLAACACASAPRPTPADADPPKGEQLPASHWKEVREETSCEAMQPGFCPGRYGFSVNVAGHFIAGPAPDGATRNGDVTPEELTKLAAAASAVASNDPHGAPSCSPEGPVPGSGDLVTMVLNDGSSVVVYRASGVPRQTCLSGGASNARALHDAFRALLLKYYPRPFP